MRKIRELSIKNKLFLAISICITLVMSVFLAGIMSMLEDYLVQQSVDTCKDRGKVVERGVQSVFETTEEYIRMISQDYRLQEGMLRYKYYKQESLSSENNKISAVAAKSFSTVALTKQLVGAALLDDEGKLLYAGQNMKKADVRQSISEEYCAVTLKYSKPVWSHELVTLHNDVDTKEYHALPIYKVLRNTDSGEFLGYIVLFVNEDSFFNIYNETSLFQNSYYYLINSEDVILSTNDRENLNQRISSDLHWMIEEGAVSELIWEEEPLLYMSAQIASDGEWLIHIMSMEDLVIQKNKLWKIAIATLAAIILLLCACAWKIFSRIMEPIVSLTNVMHQIEKNTDMSIRVDDMYYGEMGILTKGFNNLMDKLEKALNDIYQKQKEKRKLEIMVLQEQVNPHFLYNTLETISSLLMLHMEKKAMWVSQSLSEFYKLSLSKGKDIITLEEEFRIVEDYLKIQSVRYVEYMEYSMECEESILDCYVPKLLIQPIVENAIYHGLKKQKKKGMLLVSGRSSKTGKHVIIEVIDTGAGMEPDKVKEIEQSIEEGKMSLTSFGLSNVSARLRLLFEDAKITVTSTCGVATKVRLEFPTVRQENEILSK